MAVSAYAGGHPQLGAGLLDSGKMFSPLQLLIDREFQSLLWHFSAGMEVNDEQIALDLIASVGSGIGASYLDSDHTLHRYRENLWFPALLDRSVWRGEGEEERTEQKLLERARTQFREVMSRYQTPEVDGSMLTKVRQVVDQARRELVK